MFNVDEYMEVVDNLFNDEYYKFMDSVLRKKVILRIEENREVEENV